VQTLLSGRIRKPDALILAYPALNLRFNPTPSKFVFMMDMIVPMNLLHQCRSIYLPSSTEDLDLCVSPFSVPDRLIKSFPPTSIMVGGLDPFLDDAVDFAHKLAAQNVFCQLKIYPRLPHAFLGFSLLLSEARDAISLAGSWMKNAIRRKTPSRDPTQLS
jgi:acetyl esterase/lipase